MKNKQWVEGSNHLNTSFPENSLWIMKNIPSSSIQVKCPKNEKLFLMVKKSQFKILNSPLITLSLVLIVL